MKEILAFILLLGLSGCGFVFQNFDEHQYKDVSPGMAKEEVMRTLGAPQKEETLKIKNTEYEVWEYPSSTLKENQFKTLPTNYHKVFFHNEKVVQWDKDKVFAQPDYGFLQSINPEGKTKTTKITEETVTVTSTKSNP